MGVDPKTLGINLMLIIGALVVLGFLLVFGVALWTGLKMWLTEKAQRESWEEYRKRCLAPDGNPYPPFIEGVCQNCQRGDRKIYHPESGEQLCPTCYADFCRQAKRRSHLPAPLE